MARILANSFGPVSIARATPPTARIVFAGVVVMALAAGWLATPDAQAQAAATAAGADLARLLRAMAAIKALMAVAAAGAIDWRLRHAVTAPFLAAYLVAGACLAMGPGLIMRLDHVVAGAVLFHAGLALLLVAGARDTGTARALDLAWRRRIARRAG
jgi:hypothetical protein